MYKLILLLVLIPVLSFSQEREWYGYVPLRTYHLNREPIHPYHSTEGGNVGFILVYRKNNQKVFHDTNFGLVRNSYNKASFVLQKGIGIHTKVFDASINLGVATGYDILFQDKITVHWGYIIEETEQGPAVVWGTYETEERVYFAQRLPVVMRELGMIPMLNLTIKFNTGRVSPLFNISPDFINGGIVIKLK